MSKRDFPETHEIGLIEQWTKKGIPLPYQTLACELPDYEKKETYEKRDFDWEYPEGPRITLDSLGISIEEAFDGYYIDITHDFKPEKEEEMDLSGKIISKGSGRNAEIIKK
ncbi:MAG: hypothetical protein GF329_04375 [Candidatus Lokiarchaeota archaeon]|nr:hypothetical protein [Candidatus Lokiarchaeota archaeon]